MPTHRLRPLGALFGLALLLGCAGVYDDDDDAVAEGPEHTGDTGQEPEEKEEPDEEEVDSAPVDTGRKERKPRDDKRGRRDEKDREKPGGGKGKPTGKSLCFGGGGLDLQLDIAGSDVTGSLDFTSGKAKVTVPKLTGSRSGSRVDLSGTGTVNGKKKKIEVQAGKSQNGPVVRIDGNTVKGAKVVPCK